MEWSLMLSGIIVGFVLLVAAFSVVGFRVRRKRLRALSTALGSGYRKDRSYLGFSGAIALDEKSLRFAAIGEEEGALIISNYRSQMRANRIGGS
jgi:type II secretory pathway pseudopilin PulG